jgi:DNA-binding Lrp family transcriptional regulator
MYYTPQEKIILRQLSTNSRATITHLAKTAGCSRVTTIKIVDKLTKELNPRFTIEANMDRLGLSERYLIALKFREKVSEIVLKELFESDNYAQNVYLINGNFNLLVYVVADNAVNYIKWETHLAEKLSKYGLTIMPSRHVFAHFGYLPLNNSFTKFISEEHKLDETDQNMLKMLNGNSRSNYKELGDKLHISEATARYRLFRLVRHGFITRFTIAVQNPGDNYSSVVYLINYVFTETTSSTAFLNARNSYFADDDKQPAFNTFQLIFPISGRFRSFGMVLCEDKKTAIEKAVYRHRKIFRNEKIKMLYGEIVKPIKGILPFRSLDIRTDYKVVDWHEAHL